MSRAFVSLGESAPDVPGDPASALSSWLNQIEANHVSSEVVAAFIDEEGIEVPEEGADDPTDWVQENLHDDLQDWIDNQGFELRERFSVEMRTPLEANGEARPGTWFMHFTSARFTRFNDGVVRGFLGESGRQKTGREIRCPDNLTAPDDKKLWVHAYSVDWPSYLHTDSGEGPNEDMVRHGLAYGDSALLFQSDVAVEVRHVAHEHDMAVILGCSEYNAVRVKNLERVEKKGKWSEYTTLAGTAELADGDFDFDDILALVEKLEGGGLAGVGGERSKWHPLAKKR